MSGRLEGLFTSGNEAMRAVLGSAFRVGQRPATMVRIQGEVGAGKELLARFIHESTPARREAPFVKVACAGSSEESIAVELFGKEAAGQSEAGALEQASGGTLFLEDAVDLPARLQLDVLKTLKTGRFRRMSGVVNVSFEARVIVGSVQDLARAVRKGTFRADLFHRLDVLSLVLPPLRHRREDVVPLAHWFLAQFGREWVRPVPRLSPEAEKVLLVHDWPGNLRELRNVLESALIKEPREVLEPSALPIRGAEAAEVDESLLKIEVGRGEPPPPMAEVERRYIEAVLRRAKGNRSEATRVLGLSYPTVTRKIAEYEIKVPE